jgi:Skp family chaperone for outer membrane proteins
MPAIAEPPATATAAPASPATPSPASPPAAATSAPASAPAAAPAAAAGGDDSPYAAIDAALDKSGSFSPKADKPKPDAPKKPDSPAKPDAAKSPEKPIPTAADKAPGVPKELRAELDRVKAELAAKNTSLDDLQKKIADYEKRGKDTEALQKQLETERQEKDKLKADLRRAKKEVDPEFVKQYENPFQETVAEAQATIPTIQVENEDGTTRAGSWDDFQKLYGYNEFLATKESRRLFGEVGGEVAMRYYRELHRLDKIKSKALSDVHAKWKEEETAEQAKEAEQRVLHEKNQQEINNRWTKMNVEMAEKYEDYHDSPDDSEAIELRKKAAAIYDAPAKTFAEQMSKDAHHRQRVIAFPVLKLKLTKAQARIKELETENEGLKERPPGRGTRTGGAPAAPNAGESYEDYIRRTVPAQ